LYYKTGDIEMKHGMTLKIHKNGKLYTVQGIYYPYWSGTLLDPPEPSEFEIGSVTDENGVEIPEFAESEDEYIQVIEAANEQYGEEENAYWEQYAKDKDAGLA
jgi:hypothetical protein